MKPKCLPEIGKHPETSNPLSKLAYAPKLIIFERLLDFRAAVHHEWALSKHGFGYGLAVHHEDVGGRLRFYANARAVAG